MELMIVVDLIVYLSKTDKDDLHDKTAKELVMNWFDNRERGALKEVNEGDNALKGFKEVSS